MKGPIDGLHTDFRRTLLAIEADIGFEITVTGCSHTRKKTASIVADLSAPSSWKRHMILASAYKFGFRRVGIGERHIHLDADLTKPQCVTWLEKKPRKKGRA